MPKSEKSGIYRATDSHLLPFGIDHHEFVKTIEEGSIAFTQQRIRSIVDEY